MFKWTLDWTPVDVSRRWLVRLFCNPVKGNLVILGAKKETGYRIMNSFGPRAVRVE